MLNELNPVFQEYQSHRGRKSLHHLRKDCTQQPYSLAGLMDLVYRNVLDDEHIATESDFVLYTNVLWMRQL